MNSSGACPDEDALLPLAVGDDADEGVRTHAAGCAACQEALRRLRAEVAALSAVAGAAPTGPPAGASHPATVGQYFLVGPLGEGRHGPAYRGLHPALNKEVVMRLGPAEADEAAVPPALLELRQRLTRLEHPHLARVYDLDFHDRRPFVVAEYLRGADLPRYVQGEKPDPWASAALVARLARAVAEAHRHGVPHGAITPSNVLVDRGGRPYLIDLGMAWLHQGAEVPHTAGAEVGPRDDLFSLGGVLFFLLTGKASGGADDGAALAKAPRALAGVCLRALAADTAQRPADADELADALERACARPRGWLARLLKLAGLGGGPGRPA